MIVRLLSRGNGTNGSEWSESRGGKNFFNDSSNRTNKRTYWEYRD